MKKILSILLITLIILMSLAGCTTSKTYTYTVDTGDKICVEMDTTGGYDISSKLPFTISKTEDTATQGKVVKTLSQGKFIYSEYFEKYVDAAESDEKAVIIDSGSRDDVEYTFWSYNSSEYNYVIKIKDSNTGVLLSNPNSQEEAEDCFNRLTFSKDD